MKSSLGVVIFFIALISMQNSFAQSTSVSAAPTKKIRKKSDAIRRNDANLPQIQFDKTLVDLGTIKEDAVVEKAFEFTNTGTADLVIIDVKGSCGCTVPTKPSEPIAPGKRGKISVKYTAKNKVGPQKPTITVISNAQNTVEKLKLETWVVQIPGGVK